MVRPRPRLRRPRYAQLRAGARGSVRARRRCRRRQRRARGCPADPGGGPARARPRRRHLGLAQPTGVQRRQVLRPLGQQADRRLGGGDRGAARRSRARRWHRRPDRGRDRQLPRARRRALRHRPLGPADRGRLRQRRLLGDRAGGLRAPRRRGDRDRERARTATTSTWAVALPTSSLLSRVVQEQRLDLGVAFDGDGDRMLAVDGEGTLSTATRSSRSSLFTSASTSSPSP